MQKTLAISNTFVAPVAAKRIVPRISSAWYLWASYGLIAVNSVVLLSYFVGVNSSTAEGYSIKKIQSNITQLTEENKRLSLKISEKTSIATLQTEIEGSAFVPAGNPVFLEVNRFSKR